MTYELCTGKANKHLIHVFQYMEFNWCDCKLIMDSNLKILLVIIASNMAMTQSGKS